MLQLKTFIVTYSFSITLLVIIAFLIFAGIKIKKQFLKQIPFHIAAVVLAFLFYDLFLAYKDKHKKDSFFTGGYPKNYFEKSDLLGYGPRENSSIDVKKFDADSVLLYDVSYHIQNDYRNTPNSSLNSDSSAIFLGCSFTFGEGLNDNETLPYYFNECNSSGYRVLNYGFHGFGPHQMLSIVENKIIYDSLIRAGKNSIAVYSFFPDHIRRAAGYSDWDQGGPQYDIISDTLIHSGKFSDHHKLVLNSKLITRIWETSFIFKKHFSKSVKKATDYDALRTVKIVQKVNEIFKKLNIRFYVIVWDNINEQKLVDQAQIDNFISQLKSSGIPYYRVSEIVPGITDKSSHLKFFIKVDGHPNGYCNKLIADYMCAGINKR